MDMQVSYYVSNS